MKLMNRKQAKKRNLLELSEPDKVKLMRAAREQLKQSAMEAKLWNSLLEMESLAVNGNLVYNDKQVLKGLCLENMI
jgi:hypothetical protein